MPTLPLKQNFGPLLSGNHPYTSSEISWFSEILFKFWQVSFQYIYHYYFYLPLAESSWSSSSNFPRSILERPNRWRLMKCCLLSDLCHWEHSKVPSLVVDRMDYFSNSGCRGWIRLHHHLVPFQHEPKTKQRATENSLS